MTSYPSSPPPGGPNGESTPYGSSPSPGSPAPGRDGQAWAGQRGGAAGYPTPSTPGSGAPGGFGQGEAAAPPVCPRHPDRMSYVRCQRCGRPTCPECQRTAAVGVHCVDCVRDAQRGQRSKRTVLGGRARPGERPVVTLTMIGICVGLFLLDYVAPGLRNELIFTVSLSAVEPWRLLTTAFLHAGIIHLAFNMVALWFTGPFLEQALGRARFLALYLVSALGGSAAVALLTAVEDFNRGAVGASGAVFGLFGAVAVVMARLRMRNTQILGVIGINLLIGFFIPGISWQAHVGGLLTGAAIAALYAYLPERARGWGAVVGVVVIAVLLAVAVLVRYTAVGLV
jgi:membrane associated rhomboid family serine protease